MLTRNNGKFLRRTRKNTKPQFEKKADKRDRRGDYRQRSYKRLEKKPFISSYYEQKHKVKGIQHKKREGFGQIRAECANTFKQNKSLSTTLSEEEKSDID